MPTERSVLLGLIGAGIGSSLSPPLHEEEAAAQRMRCVYRVLDIDAPGRGIDAAPRLLRAAGEVGFDGLNVTHPCKRVVLDQLDELSDEAEQVGAVNTVVFTDGLAIGYNTDGIGFTRSFRRSLPDARLDRVVLVGAGGAGAAVAHAILSLGARELAVVDVDEQQAMALAASADTWFAGASQQATPEQLPGLLARADGLIHATPTGMVGHPGLPLSADLLRPELWVADIVYRPLETDLLRAARAAGCRVLGGGGMTVFQAAEAFRLFTAIEPDTERMMAHFIRLTRAEALANAARR